MEKIQIKDKVFKPYMSYSEITTVIDEVAAKLNADFKGCEDIPVILCVLNGAMLFTAELLKRLEFPLELVSIKMTSYVGTSTTGKVKAAMGLTSNIEGKRVIIVEDIVDSGYTTIALKDILKNSGATESRVCTLLHKPAALKVEGLKLDYIGKCIPNDFIVGFGLDYDELGRNFKDIYVIDD